MPATRKLDYSRIAIAAIVALIRTMPHRRSAHILKLQQHVPKIWAGKGFILYFGLGRAAILYFGLGRAAILYFVQLSCILA